MNSHWPRLILTAGDPAGIGPDICLAVAALDWPSAIAVAADPGVLGERARLLGLAIELDLLSPDAPPARHRPDRLQVLPVPARVPVVPGQPEPGNAPMVLESLDLAVHGVMSGRFDAIVTAPVSKAVLAGPGRPFSGHTEYLAAAAGTTRPVMMLCTETLRVALATTHLPLAEVPRAITRSGLREVMTILHADLRRLFGIADPRILVCGLNPHAGESGQLGREEIETITPVIKALAADGMQVRGPLPADTLFLPRELDRADAVLAMYHDQGLPVLKHAGFGQAVNITLGLPFVRTSVDHGTAFDLAGTGRADPGSLQAAVRLAIELATRAGS